MHNECLVSFCQMNNVFVSHKIFMSSHFSSEERDKIVSRTVEDTHTCYKLKKNDTHTHTQTDVMFDRQTANLYNFLLYLQ